MSATLTIREVIAEAESGLEAAGSTEAAAEALFLASHAEGLKLSELRSRGREAATPKLVKFMNEAVARRRSREPVQHITGLQEFYGLDMRVTPDVLIPRPETELIVDEALAFLKAKKPGTRLKCLDLCTGCGCVAIAIAKNAPDLTFEAVDISHAAIEVARENAKAHGVMEKIKFVEGDLFEPVSEVRFDLITANPPYVVEADIATLAPEVKLFEPKIALSGGTDGLDMIRRVTFATPKYLKSGALFVMEFGFGEADAVQELLEKSGAFVEITIKKDLGGIERVVTARRI